MLSNDFVRPARERVTVEVSEQVRRLAEDIEALKRKNAARGLLKSGATLKQATALCCEMLERRAELSWSTLKRFLSASPAASSRTTAVELKDFVSTFLPAKDPPVVEHLSRLVSLVGRVELLDRLLAQVEEARSAALTKIGFEIDLCCLELKWGSAMEEAVPQTVATRRMEVEASPSPAFDVFISHASEDKAAFVEPLANHLVQHGLKVWYDAFTLKLGDRLR